jgi:hypothetical protein
VAKTAQIQLRVTPAQKSELTRCARAAGLDLSAWILGALLPDKRERFKALVRTLAESSEPAFVLAEIHDLLAAAGRAEVGKITDLIDAPRFDPVRANQVAAMIETRAAQLGVRPPEWVEHVAPLTTPWFASDLIGLRLHLLCHSPPAFRRRNLFVDSKVGDRV